MVDSGLRYLSSSMRGGYLTASAASISFSADDSNLIAIAIAKCGKMNRRSTRQPSRRRETMFSKTDKSDQAEASAPSDFSTRPVSKDSTPSLVSANLKVVGNLTTDSELHIDGAVEGDIRCKQLTVGEFALLAGKITADEIEVRGRVEGEIHARSVHMTGTAEIVGDIWHDSLSIDSGAFLDGHCRRNDSAAQMEETPAAGAASPSFISEARARRQEP